MLEISRDRNMFKYLILATSVFTLVQNCYATKKIEGCTNNELNDCAVDRPVNGIADKMLNDTLQEMNRKLGNANAILGFTYLLINTTCDEIGNKTIGISNEMSQLKTYAENVYNKTNLHYKDIETKAMATGVLKYTSPYVFAMRLAGEDRKNLIDPLQRIIMNSHAIDENIKQHCVNLMMAAINFKFEFINDLSKIEEEYPEEFSKIETVKGWDSMHRPMPSNSTSEILHVDRQIIAATEKYEKRLEPYLEQFRQIERTLSIRQTSED